MRRDLQDGVLLDDPFVELDVDARGERGLLGVAFDPEFAENQFVYVYYTTSDSPIHNRVSRFTADGNVAVDGSEAVILNLENLSGATNHNGGAIHFGIDGKLYIGVGDNANGSNAQSTDNRLGKLLRINSNGTIPDDNPTLGTGVNQSIWALGLRNPFTFAVQPDSGRIFINDVGQNKWEEINEGLEGANYGWPDAEGPTNDRDFESPLYAYRHARGQPQGCAISGGTFYNPATVQFPSKFLGDYFFADLCGRFIWSYDPTTDAAAEFATELPSAMVDLKVDDDGGLYYLARGAGETTGSLHKIEFEEVEPPEITIDNVSIREGNSGSKIAEFTVALSAAAAAEVSVKFATANQTATAGVDYTAKSGSLSFQPGQLTKTIRVTIRSDRKVEPNEKFSVKLTKPKGATIVDNKGVGTIQNDDESARQLVQQDALAREVNAASASSPSTAAYNYRESLTALTRSHAKDPSVKPVAGAKARVQAIEVSLAGNPVGEVHLTDVVFSELGWLSDDKRRHRSGPNLMYSAQ